DQDHHHLQQRSLKRKLVLRETSASGEALAYPSPPMSNPPTPSNTQRVELSGNHGGRSVPLAPTTSGGPMTSFGPNVPSTHSAPPPTYFGQPYSAFEVGPSTNLPAPVSSQAWQPGPFSYPGQAYPATPSRGTGSSASRGRRSKTHVASACINCKRAHLSCDVNRPCARCVASGKQDTCVDVQHKKRGRPRLREEGEGKGDQGGQESVSRPRASSGISQASSRPIAGVRHRRGESFRSLISQTSEGSPSYTASTPSTYLPSVPRPSPYGAQLPSTPRSSQPTYEVATALLNLDFVIVRANRPFQQIMLPGQDLTGRQVADVAAPADDESFQAIRSHLRAEREARDPTYMPPIMQPGQDPVQDIPEAEAEQFTEGFQDHTYTWTHTRLGPASQQFPVRIRLAKAHSYFVVLTLPSFRPVEPPPQPLAPMYSGPLALGPPLHQPDRFVAAPSPAPAPPRSTAQSTTAPGYMPFQGVMAPPPGQPYHGPPQYGPPRPYQTPPSTMPPPDQLYPHYPHLAPASSRLPVAEPPIQPAAFTPRSMPREILPSTRASALQLPPIIAPGGSGGSGSVGGSQSQAGAEEGEGEEEQGMQSPKKRRRVGIHDVLQR
ncbi:hypothetical protein D0864_14366, partial [Hortaea werneckii]